MVYNNSDVVYVKVTSPGMAGPCRQLKYKKMFDILLFILFTSLVSGFNDAAAFLHFDWPSKVKFEQTH